MISPIIWFDPVIEYQDTENMQVKLNEVSKRDEEELKKKCVTQSRNM